MQKSATVLDQLGQMQKDSAAEGIKRVTFEWTKGLITGVNDLEVGNLGGVLDCNGLVAKKREIERSRGLVSFCTTAVTGNPIGIYQQTELDGDRKLFLLTTDFLYTLIGGVWKVVTAYIGDEDYPPSFESWQDVVLFTSFTDTVKEWNLVTNRPLTTPALAPGTPGSNPKTIANGAFDYMVGGVRYTKAAAETAFTAAHIVSIGKWGVFKVCIDSAGTITTVVPGATQAYDTEALAVAAIPATTASTAYIGTLTVKAKADAWDANTDNLLDGSDCTEANFYSRTSDLDLNAFSGVNTKAGCMALFKSRLILGMLNEVGEMSPWRVKWSQTGTYNSFTGVGSGFQDLLETPGPVLTMQTILDKLFVFKTDSIWECIYVGSPNIFTILPVVTGVGLSAKASVDVVTGTGGNAEAIIFLGNDDVYIFDGRIATPIGGEFIQKYIFGVNSIVDPVYRGRSVGKYIKEDKQYWLTLPLTGSTYPNLTLIYDFLTSSWWKVSLGVPLRCMGDSIKSGGLTWNNTLGTWDNSVASWDDAYLAEGAIKIIVGSGTTPTYEIDFASNVVAGTVPSAYLETPDQMYEAETRWLQISVELKGSNGAELFYSKDEGANWISLGTKAGSSAGYKVLDWYMNFTTEKTRFKLALGSNTTAIRKNKGFVTLRTV